MATLAIQAGGSQLRVRNGRFVVASGKITLAERPCHEITEIICFGRVELTAEAREVAFAQGIEVLFFAPGGRYRGRFAAFESSQGDRRLRQFACCSSLDQRLAIARHLVAGKLANQRAILMRARRDGTAAEQLTPLIDGLKLVAGRLETADSIALLMGMEGHGASLYFRAFPHLIKNPDFSFEGRNRRPPRDPANACLSFGYAILLGRAETAVRLAGFDPFIGLLHEAGRGKPALALDLMEEFRPLIDRLVLRLINLRQLQPTDFINPDATLEAAGSLAEAEEPAAEPHAEAAEAAAAQPADPRPAVWMGPAARAILLRELFDLWRTPFPYPQRGGRHPLGEIINMQALQIAACIDGREEPYRPFLSE